MVGKGPYKVDGFFWEADGKSFITYFNGAMFTFSTDSCNFRRARGDMQMIVTNWTRKVLMDWKRAYALAVDSDIDDE